MTKINRTTCLTWTRKMLAREKGLSLDMVEPTSSLRDDLLFSDDEIKALEIPIEEDDFKDVNVNVAPSRLASRVTVVGLRGVIWAGIPVANRK
jgi:hypothetical protein